MAMKISRNFRSTCSRLVLPRPVIKFLETCMVMVDAPAGRRPAEMRRMLLGTAPARLIQSTPL